MHERRTASGSQPRQSFGPTAEDEAFTLTDLARIRTMVSAAGATVGVPPDDLADLTSAVAEIASNAIRHGGGQGWLTIQELPRELVVEIRDEGPGLPAAPPTARPAADATSGRGLWLARTWCPELVVVSTPGGVRVRLSAPRGTGAGTRSPAGSGELDSGPTRSIIL